MRGMRSFEDFAPKDWPKHKHEPCFYCGAPRQITRRGRAKVRNLLPVPKGSRFYWIIGYGYGIEACSCAESIEVRKKVDRLMGTLNSV